MLTAEMGSRQPQHLAQAIRKVEARLDIDLDGLAVELEHDSHHAPRA
jgi:hypothetical protein